MATLNLGLLADSRTQLDDLQTTVESANFPVAAALLTRSDNLTALPEVDLWVVRVDFESEHSHTIIDQIDALDIPVIYDEAESYVSLDIEERARRFSRKIELCGYRPETRDVKISRATEVWVLAASAGGPEAVIEFIKHVPAEISKVAFIYVQHTDESMTDALVKSLQRHSVWQVYYVSSPHIICERGIYVISPSHQLDISDTGVLNPVYSPWPGPYKPSIDQVVAKVWRRYGRDSGVIVFSGMGDDGARTCCLIKNAGGQVWVQAPETCIVDSMPVEVINTECVQYSGSPQALAENFSAYQTRRHDLDGKANEAKLL